MATRIVTYQGLDQTLLALFPEFTEEYKSKFDYWVDWDKPPGIYLVFGFVVFPYLISLFDARQDEKLIRRLFAFFEDLASSKDRNVLDLLYLELIHKLLYAPDHLRKAWPYMGEKTKDLTKKAAKVLRVQMDVGT